MSDVCEKSWKSRYGGEAVMRTEEITLIIEFIAISISTWLVFAGR